MPFYVELMSFWFRQSPQLVIDGLQVGLDAVNINSNVGDGGCEELSVRCGFYANVALALEVLMDWAKDKATF